MYSLQVTEALNELAETTTCIIDHGYQDMVEYAGIQIILYIPVLPKKFFQLSMTNFHVHGNLFLFMFITRL